MRTLIWFREDLRCTDNIALYEAAKSATKGMAAIFLVTPRFWQKHAMAPIRIQFMLEGLNLLNQALAKKNVALKIISVENSQNPAKTLYQYAQKINANQLFFNRQYEFDELKRDQIVTDYFQSRGISVHSYDDQIIFPATAIRTQTGEPFKVFTPFKRAWLKKAYEEGIPGNFPAPKKQAELIDAPSLLSNSSFYDLKHWPAGETYAIKRLRHFIEHKITSYHETRDFPALNGTSQLSPYLSTGMISSRQCFNATLQFNHGEFDSGNRGAIMWINELIWREFYKIILIAFPQISKNKAFKPETDKIIWCQDGKLLRAWQQGLTGYPLVDAAMRQLNTTGWMHNRLRMVVAMFLTKTLFLDWRLGEKYFMQHLIDGDLAANNGGWQWSASTGVDSVPYFRIFNPLRQSERFDPEGKFIRNFCPELADLDNKTIHQPYQNQALFSKPINYPYPIVNHAHAKARVVAVFKGNHKGK